MGDAIVLAVEDGVSSGSAVDVLAFGVENWSGM